MATEYILTTWKDHVMLAADTASSLDEAARKWKEAFARHPSATSVTINRKVTSRLQPSGQWVLHVTTNDPEGPPFRTIGPFPTYREALRWRGDPCNQEVLGTRATTKFAEIDSPVDE